MKSVGEALELPLDTRSKNGKAAAFSSDSNFVLFPHRFLLEEAWEHSEREGSEGEEAWEEREEEREEERRTRTALERYCLGDAHSLKHVLPCLHHTTVSMSHSHCHPACAVTCAGSLDCCDMCCSRLSPLTCAVTCARFLDSTIEAARRETGRQRVLVLLATDRQAPLTHLIQSTIAMPHVTVIHTSAAHSVLQEFVNLTGARPPPPHASHVRVLLLLHKLMQGARKMCLSCHVPRMSSASPCHLVMRLLLAAHVNLSVYEIWQRDERDIAQMLDHISKTREQVMDHESARVCERASCSQWQL